jgi:SAM-dependent methyltransferase
MDARLIEKVRADLIAVRYTKRSLRAELDRYTTHTPRQLGLAHYDYDALDVLVSGLMRSDSAPGVKEPRDAEMIHLEPTPARVILELTDRVPLRPGDVFYDLGSGLGRVAILVHLLTGVRARGVEVDPAYCAHATRTAREFGLTGVSFLQGDARDADYAGGTVFYLFSPFKGHMLQQVLSRLQCEASLRPLRVCSYGPCTPVIARQSWLISTDDNADHEFKLALFRSR